VGDFTASGCHAMNRRSTLRAVSPSTHTCAGSMGACPCATWMRLTPAGCRNWAKRTKGMP
jgi:hypothetical protein